MRPNVVPLSDVEGERKGGFVREGSRISRPGGGGWGGSYKGRMGGSSRRGARERRREAARG